MSTDSCDTAVTFNNSIYLTDPTHGANDVLRRACDYERSPTHSKKYMVPLFKIHQNDPTFRAIISAAYKHCDENHPQVKFINSVYKEAVGRDENLLFPKAAEAKSGAVAIVFERNSNYFDTKDRLVNDTYKFRVEASNVADLAQITNHMNGVDCVRNIISPSDESRRKPNKAVHFEEHRALTDLTDGSRKTVDRVVEVGSDRRKTITETSRETSAVEDSEEEKHLRLAMQESLEMKRREDERKRAETAPYGYPEPRYGSRYAPEPGYAPEPRYAPDPRYHSAPHYEDYKSIHPDEPRFGSYAGRYPEPRFEPRPRYDASLPRFDEAPAPAPAPAAAPTASRVRVLPPSDSF